MKASGDLDQAGALRVFIGERRLGFLHFGAKIFQ